MLWFVMIYKNSISNNKTICQISDVYRSTNHVSSTSNVYEGLLSAPLLIMNHLRCNMGLSSFEMLQFLKLKIEMWKNPVISDVIMRGKRETT